MDSLMGVFKKDKKEKKDKPAKGGSGRAASGGEAAAAPKAGIKKVLQEPMPPEKELNELFDQLLQTLGVGADQKAMMANLDSTNKWTLILQEREKLRTTGAGSPTRFAKELEGGKISLKELEALRISLANEPVRWTNEFVQAGGVDLMFAHLVALQQKPQKQAADLDYLTEYTRCLKNLMNVKAGLEAVVATKGAIPALIATLDFVSDRTQASILEALAGLSCPDIVSDGHAIILAAMQQPAGATGRTRLAQVVEFLRGDAYSMELKVSAMTLVNALVNYTPALDARKDFRDSLAIYDVVAALKRKVQAPGAVKEHMLHALETQLYVFEEALDDDNGGGAGGTGGRGARGGQAPSESATELFAQLVNAVRRTPAADVLPSVVQHLQLVRRDGRLGKLAWEVLDAFVEVLAATPPNADAAEYGAAAARAMVAALKGDNALMLSAMAPPSATAIAADAALSADEKVKRLTVLVATQAAEIEDLKQRPAAGAPPPPPPPGLKPPPLKKPPGPPPPPGAEPAAAAEDGGEAPTGGPPPPPPPPGGGPPPPPGKGPPPPPGKGKAAPAGLPKKPVIKPRVAMKQLHWAKLPDRLVPRSVWASLSDEHVRLDADELEALFAANAPVPKPPEDEAKAKNAVIQVLDTKRHNNISIMLSRFKEFDYATLRAHLLALSDSDPLLMGDNLVALKQYTPTAEERLLLEPYVGSPKREKLGAPERYFLEVMSIPRLDARLETFYVRQTFAPKLAALHESTAAIQGAVDETRASKRFGQALELVLAIGNYINGSTFRGGAYGFKLEALVKLSEIKTASNKETMMHYLAELAETRYPNLRDLGADFAHLEPATKEPIQQVTADANVLRKGVGLVEKELGQLPPDSTDRLKQVLTEFYEPARAQMDEATAALAALDKSYRELAAYYGEDDTVDSQTFFGYIWRFVSGFEKAKEDNARRKALAAKQAEIAAATAQRRREQEARKSSKAGVQAPGGGSPEGGAGGEEGKKDKGGEKGILDQQLNRMRAGVISRGRGGPPDRETNAEVANEALALFTKLKGRQQDAAPAPAPASAPAPAAPASEGDA